MRDKIMEVRNAPPCSVSKKFTSSSSPVPPLCKGRWPEGPEGLLVLSPQSLRDSSQRHAQESVPYGKGSQVG